MAKRLGKISASVPKILIDIHGKSFIEIQLNYYAEQGITDFIYLTGHLSKDIEEKIEQLQKVHPSLNLDYICEGPDSYGTGGAVKNAFENLSYEEAFITYGDNYLDFNLKNFSQFCESNEILSTMTVYKNNNKFDKSNIDFKDGLVVDYCKDNLNKDFEYIDYGLSYFTRDFYLSLSAEKKFDLSHILKKASQKKSLYGFEVFNRFYEIGSLSSLNEFKLKIER